MTALRTVVLALPLAVAFAACSSNTTAPPSPTPTATPFATLVGSPTAPPSNAPGVVVDPSLLAVL
ncbi:MAG: hypothetical protein L0221_09720, partial [Chloroflexi bacterium]|nr:hypothetical protein [Chloroflexota bacterium]